MKALGSTEELLGELIGLRQVGARGTLGGAVECVDIKRNTRGEGDSLGLNKNFQTRFIAFGIFLTLRCESQGSERD